MSRRILIVDDHARFRTAARLVLEDEGYDVVGEAGDGLSALDAVRSLRPDVVLLDINLPDIDGIEVASRLTREGVPGAIVLVSSRDASDFGPLIGECGARGFIPKGELSGESLEALLA